MTLEQFKKLCSIYGRVKAIRFFKRSVKNLDNEYDGKILTDEEREGLKL